MTTYYQDQPFEVQRDILKLHNPYKRMAQAIEWSSGFRQAVTSYDDEPGDPPTGPTPEFVEGFRYGKAWMMVWDDKAKGYPKTTIQEGIESLTEVAP